MPFSSNTRNNEFGHAQVLRDIEYLYLMLAQRGIGVGDSLAQSEVNGMSQELGDDMLGGRAPWQVQGGQNIVNITTGLGTLIRIGKGNLLATYGGGTQLTGLKSSATSISSIAAGELNGAGDGPDITDTTTYQDGLCWGTIVSTGQNVFVANKATPDGGAAQQDTPSLYALPENAYTYSLRSVLVAKSGGGVVPVFLTWRV